MTTIREAAQQALEALTAHADLLGTMYLKMDAITALRNALAQPAPEPVAWLHVPHPDNGLSPKPSLSPQREPSMYGASVPLYTAPPQRQPLTEEEIERICEEYHSPRQLARAVERVHGIGGKE